MNAKDKAKELFDKMVSTYDITSDFCYDSTAKQCALICVDEIIRANPHSNPFNTDVHSTMDYWMEVKKEIQAI